jgi:hypothetical protein
MIGNNVQAPSRRFISSNLTAGQQPHLHWHTGASVGTFLLITDKVYFVGRDASRIPHYMMIPYLKISQYMIPLIDFDSIMLYIVSVHREHYQ